MALRAASAALLQLIHVTLTASMFTMPLQKQHVPVSVGGRIVSHKTAYFGTIFTGLSDAQEFTVIFDTGSGHLILPSSACTDDPCLQHRRYDRSASRSAIDINGDGEEALDADDRDQVNIAYGTGEILGEFVREVVCIGTTVSVGANSSSLPQQCIEARVVLATEMTPNPFSAFEFDGVLGMGLNSLALDPEFHIFSQLAGGEAVDPVFGVFLSRHDSVSSEISFGGHDTRFMQGALQMAPVISPELGYWQVRVHSIKVGNRTLPLCDDGGCSAILDTGTSMLGVPNVCLKTLIGQTARRVSKKSPDDSIDCRTVPGPSISFDLGGFWIELGEEDYSRPVPSQIKSDNNTAAQLICKASLLPVDMPAIGPKVFLWGEPVLRRYYTAYDTRGPQVGFATAARVGANDSRILYT